MRRARTFAARRAPALLLALLLALLPLGAAHEDLDTPEAQRAIEILVASEPFASWLAERDLATLEIEAHLEEGRWKFDLHTAEWEEWLGWALVDLEAGELVDGFAPLPLEPEAERAGEAAATRRALDDPEVMAIVGDPQLWERETWYDRFEVTWSVSFQRGLDAIEAVYDTAQDDPERLSFREIRRPWALSDEAGLADRRDRAVALAWDAPGIEEALDGVDDWTVYSEELPSAEGEDLWSVSFDAADRTLFVARVDVAAERVLEAAQP